MPTKNSNRDYKTVATAHIERAGYGDIYRMSDEEVGTAEVHINPEGTIIMMDGNADVMARLLEEIDDRR